MSDEVFRANLVFWAEITDARIQYWKNQLRNGADTRYCIFDSQKQLGARKNYHVSPLGHAIICEEVKKE